MPNYLPFILAGAGVAYVTIGGKKKKKEPVISVSDDCSEVKVMGVAPEKLMEKAGDEKFGKKFQAAIKSWSKETLDLEGWFHERPNLNPEDLDDFAMEIAAWRYPQCNIAEDMEFNSLPFRIYILVFAAVVAHAVEHGIVTAQQIVDMMNEGAVSGLGPLMPEGVSASRQMPPEIQMVLM